MFVIAIVHHWSLAIAHQIATSVSVVQDADSSNESAPPHPVPLNAESSTPLEVLVAVVSFESTLDPTHPSARLFSLLVYPQKQLAQPQLLVNATCHRPVCRNLVSGIWIQWNHRIVVSRLVVLRAAVVVVMFISHYLLLNHHHHRQNWWAVAPAATSQGSLIGAQIQGQIAKLLSAAR